MTFRLLFPRIQRYKENSGFNLEFNTQVEYEKTEDCLTYIRYPTKFLTVRVLGFGFTLGI